LAPPFLIHPIGTVRRQGDRTFIDIKRFIPGTRFEKETVRVPDWV
jgi:hypothetical protein